MSNTILILLLGIIKGAVIGYIFTKNFFKKKTVQLQFELSQEKTLHQATQATLTKIETESKFDKNLLIEARLLAARFETENKNIIHQISNLQQDIEKQKQIHDSKQDEITRLSELNAGLQAKHAEALKAIEEQKQFIEASNKGLKEAFNSLSSDVIKQNNQVFLDLAKTSFDKQLTEARGDLDKRQQAIESMVKPLSETLTKFDSKIQDIEKARQGAYSEIKVFLDTMRITTDKLQNETSSLAHALKSSQVRGKYGEIGLRRIVEFAGMSEFCDFEEQVSINGEDGRLRPDLIVKLPGSRNIIIDAKVPLAEYMRAFETSNEQEKLQHLQNHALAVRSHLKLLSQKSYWSQFKDSPDYVVMYLQIESSFGAALQADQKLIEDGINNNIIFATPTTLITLLKTVAFSWQQVKIAQNIYELRDAGIELYNRTVTFIGHFNTLGGNLKSAVENYNKTVGSLDTRFVPQARKMKEIGGTLMDKDINELQKIDNSIRDSQLTDETNTKEVV